MSRERIAASLPSLVLAIIAAGYVWASYDYTLAARSLPWIAGALASVLALIDVAARGESIRRETRSSPTARGNAPARDDEPRPSAPHSFSQEAAAFAWIGAFLPLVIVLGFYAAILLYVFCYLRLYAGKGALASSGTAFGVAGFLYVVFELLMGYEIFGGLLGGDYP